MRYAHILSRVTGTYWLITEDALEGISALIESRIAGIESTVLNAAQPQAPAAPASVAVIPIHGVIGKRLSAMEMACGGCDIDQLRASFDAANLDPSVDKIVLHVDSPGGTVTGVPELAQHIYSSKQKPVEAVTDSLMASAAYYIASAADQITATPTAMVGSIGVALQVRESTGSTSADGNTRLRVFRSGADKMVGLDGPMSPEQAKNYQESVDTLGAMFRADVTKARPSVKADSMTGRVFFGEDAVRRGLVDLITPQLSIS